MTARVAGRPRLLDLFCCQGGAAAGYRAAGFHVTGVDIDSRHGERYRQAGDVFWTRDALAFLRGHAAWIRRVFAAVHASPPCQRYSACQRIRDRDHPDLIGLVREALERVGLPYVIENVEDARPELRDPVTLCGASFGLRTYRHRLFETGNGYALEQPEHAEHTEHTVKMGRPLSVGQWYHAVGNFSNVPYVRADMGMPWANRDGLREAVPPAYTRWIGARLLDHIGTAGAVAA